VTGNLNDGVIAFVGGEMITMKNVVLNRLLTRGPRRPHRRSQRRWKAVGFGSQAVAAFPWHQEGTKGVPPMVVHFQLRPDRLAH
jgi:hypothetical protein